MPNYVPTTEIDWMLQDKSKQFREAFKNVSRFMEDGSDVNNAEMETYILTMHRLLIQIRTLRYARGYQIPLEAPKSESQLTLELKKL